MSWNSTQYLNSPGGPRTRACRFFAGARPFRFFLARRYLFAIHLCTNRTIIPKKPRFSCFSSFPTLLNACLFNNVKGKELVNYIEISNIYLDPYLMRIASVTLFSFPITATF